MKAWLLTLLLPLTAFAHVGSPDVFFEGHAGPHAVRVVIRPPPTLPGLADVDVRAADDITAVTVRAAFADAGTEAAPAPIPMSPVSGDLHLFHAVMWLLRDGAYTVTVTLESAGGGQDSVILPLASAALRSPVMPPALQMALVALGVLLVLSAIALAGAAARDSMLAPGATPMQRDRTRGRIAAGLAALILGGSIYAGTLRWQSMDRAFREDRVAKPLPVDATVRTSGGLRFLRLTPPPERAANAAWGNLVTDHGKLMHCFLIGPPNEAQTFAHLHPVRLNSQTFEGVLPPLPAGPYQFYAELTHVNGRSDTLTARVDLPEPLEPARQPAWNPADDVWCQTPRALEETSLPPIELDPDDSWHLRSAVTTTRVSPLNAVQRMVFQNAGDFVENRPTTLRFAVYGAGGSSMEIQPYMGMLGHAAIYRRDGEVFAHLHPGGTISMAAQELFENRARPGGPPATPAPRLLGHEVTFPYAFPRAGDYRIWVQVRLEGRVATGVFDVKVQPAP